MSSDNLLIKVKQLREITGVGFKDCKNAIDETKGDIEKSIELLRKKGIAKASKRMGRVAGEGLVCIYEQGNSFSMIEINSETDFVAKNSDFINFAEEVSKLAFTKVGKMNDILISEMNNKKNVQDNLVSLISKIGEKITLRRSDFIKSEKCINFSYTHSAVKANVGQIGVLLSLETTKTKNELSVFGKQLAMHIAASSPLGIDKSDLNQNSNIHHMSYLPFLHNSISILYIFWPCSFPPLCLSLYTYLKKFLQYHLFLILKIHQDLHYQSIQIYLPQSLPYNIAYKFLSNVQKYLQDQKLFRPMDMVQVANL